MFDGKPRKRADGRWEIQLTIGKDENGKRIRKSFYGTKEKEVIAKKDAWLSGNHCDSMDDNHSSKSFSDWADYWLALKKTTVRPYTYQNTYYTRVKKYLKPYFGQRDLEAITQMDIQMFFLKHQHLSLALQKTLKVILHDMFHKAVTNDLCRKNPVVDIKLNSTKKKQERTCLNKTQQQAAIEWAIANEQYDILTVLKTGIRRGELLGLRWMDVDMQNKIISVHQSYCDGIDGEEPDLGLKTACSERKIPVDDELIYYLQKIKRINELVFPYSSARAYGSHISHVLRRMARECDLPYVTLHGLRHTYGTVLREDHVDIYTISKLLGHSSVKVTESIYIHNDVEVLRMALQNWFHMRESDENLTAI